MPSHTPLHHIMKGVFTAVSFTKYIMSSFQGKRKITGDVKKAKKKSHNLKKVSIRIEFLEVRILKWFDIPYSSGPCFIRDKNSQS